MQNTKSLTYFDERMGIDTILVAITGSRMVGYLHISDAALPVPTATPDDQQLNALYVSRTHQQGGIGSRRMDRALTLPRVKSASNLYVDVWNENKKALRFYTCYGFEVIGETDVVVNSKVIGKNLIMHLALADAVKPKARRSV